MNIRDYFRPVETMTPESIQKLMSERRPDEYNLVDVRQPKEYEAEHLPGARLMPMAELSDRLNELDPQKTTIIY